MCGVVDLQVSRLGVCVCLAPSLCWGLQGVVVSVQGNVGAVARRGVCLSPHVCLCEVLSVCAMPEGWVLFMCGVPVCVCVCCVLCESCLCELFGGDSLGLCCLPALQCVAGVCVCCLNELCLRVYVCVSCPMCCVCVCLCVLTVCTVCDCVYLQGMCLS